MVNFVILDLNRLLVVCLHVSMGMMLGQGSGKVCVLLEPMHEHVLISTVDTKVALFTELGIYFFVFCFPEFLSLSLLTFSLRPPRWIQ